MSITYSLSSVSFFSPISISFKTKTTMICAIPGAETKGVGASEAVLISAVRKENVKRPPVWLMRQAGRYVKAVCFASSDETTETQPLEEKIQDSQLKTKDFAVLRRQLMTVFLSSYVFAQADSLNTVSALQSVGLREYIDTFDGYSFKYPKNWIQVRGANADIFFRDPFILDENLSLELSSPSSSNYKSIEDLGPPEVAGKNVLKQYLTEFMSTRLGVRRESSILSTSSRIADDGKMYYQVEVNIKSYANNNELAVMPQDRVARLEWDRHYLSVLGVENNQLYVLRLQVPENVFVEEESDLRQILDSFRVNKVIV